MLELIEFFATAIGIAVMLAGLEYLVDGVILGRSGWWEK